MSTSTPIQKRKYNAVYRARRKGVEVKTRENTIYRHLNGQGLTYSSAEAILIAEYGFCTQLTIN